MDKLTLWLYRLAIWFVPRLPERFGYWLFARVGDCAFFLNTGARRTYEKNLAHVLGADAPPRESKRITRKALQNLMKNYFDLFRVHRLSADQIWAQLDSVTGLEHLDQAIALGKGIAGGSAHFGNFNLFVHLTALYFQGKHPIVVPVERLKNPGVFDLVTRQRAAQGIELVPSDQAARVLLKKLRSGAILGLAIDLDPTRSGPVVNFFGAPAQLPDGAAALAVKFQAPLILAFIRRLDNNKCAVTIEPPMELERTGDLARDTRAALEKIVARMEYWIRQYPEQWILFSPVWEEDK
jgi:KDO2-lipid IV(A) lauroyltransferase